MQIGQMIAKEHGVKPILVQKLESLMPAPGATCFVPAGLEEPLERIQEMLIVVHEQNFGGGVRVILVVVHCEPSQGLIATLRFRLRSALTRDGMECICSVAIKISFDAANLKRSCL